MQMPVFDGVVDDAHHWGDFGNADHLPQAACKKERQRNEFEKPSHGGLSGSSRTKTARERS